MDGVDKIKKQIGKDAQKEADKLLADARAEAAKIRKDAKSATDAKKKQIVSDGEKEAEMAKQRVLSSAKLEVHNLELKSQENVIQQVFEKASAKLSNLQKKGGAKYEKALNTLIKEAAAELGIKGPVLGFSKGDAKVGKKLASKHKAKLGSAVEISGGVIVEKKDGSLRVDNSFERRMERNADTLRLEIAKILYGGGK